MVERRTIVCAAAAAAGLIVGAACSFDADVKGCTSDADCLRSRVCVKGICQFPADHGDRRGDRDSDSDEGPSDTSDRDDRIDARPPPPDDTGGDPGNPPDARSDGVVPPDDSDGERPLSCNEFATCQFIACERYDYSCKEQFSRRTSEQQIRQLDDRQQCMRNNCTGKQGRARIRCAVKNCEAEWKQCGNRPGSGAGLDCGEFHACVHLCNGRPKRQACLKDCRKRAPAAAQMAFSRYNQCVQNNCSGTKGRTHLKCIRNNCLSELSGCWDC